MKHIYSLIILSIFFSMKIVAYEIGIPLAEGDASPYYGCCYVRSSLETQNDMLYYVIKGSEVVQGIAYSKMCIDVIGLSSFTGGVHEMDPAEEPAHADVLFIRQDGGKVYCLSGDGTCEWLLVDFSLGKGDVFINGIGERYIVKETGTFEDDANGIIRISKAKPKMLRLVSEDGTKEDIWVEGIGSLQWGFLPDYVVQTIKPFQSTELSRSLKLWMAAAPECSVRRSINDENFKLQPFQEISDETAGDITEASLAYSFIGNDLRIQGYYPLNIYPCFVSAKITGTRIDISFHQVASQDIVKGRHYAKIDVRITGFNEGTYEIYLEGESTPIQHYHPFVEDGKVWVVESLLGAPPYYTTQTFELAGDTTIANHLCKKLMVEEKPYFEESRYEPVVGYLMAIYEEDKKVYFCLKDHTEFLLMYDFGAKEGDELNVWYPNIPFFGNRLASFHYQVGPRSTSGNFSELKLYDIGAKEDLEKETGRELPINTYSFRWVEGLGSYNSPLINGGAAWYGWSGRIIDCHVGDRYLLYDKESFDYLNTLTGILAPSIVNCKSVNGQWYDLSGRRLTTPPTKGIYIRDGKKVLVR